MPFILLLEQEKQFWTSRTPSSPAGGHNVWLGFKLAPTTATSFPIAHPHFPDSSTSLPPLKRTSSSEWENLEFKDAVKYKKQRQSS